MRLAWGPLGRTWGRAAHPQGSRRLPSWTGHPAAGNLVVLEDPRLRLTVSISLETAQIRGEETDMKPVTPQEPTPPATTPKSPHLGPLQRVCLRPCTRGGQPEVQLLASSQPQWACPPEISRVVRMSPHHIVDTTFIKVLRKQSLKVDQGQHGRQKWNKGSDKSLPTSGHILKRSSYGSLSQTRGQGEKRKYLEKTVFVSGQYSPSSAAPEARNM